jgi:hypothetical protein
VSSLACPCGASHDGDAPGSRYFVSVVDGGKWRPASGPYHTHEDALADVEEVRKIGEDVDPRAVFYAWGTVRVDADAAPKEGILSAELQKRRGEKAA